MSVSAGCLLDTARVYDLTLVTADQRLLRTPGYAVLANVWIRKMARLTMS